MPVVSWGVMGVRFHRGGGGGILGSPPPPPPPPRTLDKINSNYKISLDGFLFLMRSVED